jgi:transposase
MKPYTQHLRECVITALEDGVETQAEIAERFRVSKSTVEKWWYRWQATGNCVALPYAGGPKRRLSTEQLETLRQLLMQGAVSQGWENDLWTAKRVAETIRKHFGIECSSRHAWTILRRYLGWTSQKPIQRLKERDDAEIQRWRDQDFPRILREATQKEAYLVFIDESGFMLEPIIRRTFAPPGKTPIIKVADPHGRISVAGAITISPLQQRLGFLYHLLPDNANFHGASIVQFLDEICHRISRPIIVLWDGFSIHTSEPVNKYLERHRRITLEEFPAHAPELNPVDKAWLYTKYDRLPNYAPSTLDELRHRLIQEFIALQSKPNVLAWCIAETGLNLVL